MAVWERVLQVGHCRPNQTKRLGLAVQNALLILACHPNRIQGMEMLSITHITRQREQARRCGQLMIPQVRLLMGSSVN